MNAYVKLVVGLCAVFCLAGVADAEEWIILGPRALGMGGAGVAAVDDVTASYWNPAALSRARLLGVQVDFGVSIGAEGGILQEVDELYDTISNPGPNGYTLEDALNVLDDPAATSAQKTDALGDLMVAMTQVPELGGDGEGVVGNAYAAVQMKFKNFGFAVSGFGYAAVGPYLNLDSSAGWNLVEGEADVQTQLETMFGDQLVNVGGNAFTQPESAQLATDISTILLTADPTLTQAEADNAANELVFIADQAPGVDMSNPTIQQIITNVAQGTADAATGGTTTDVFGDNVGAVTRAARIYEYRVTYYDRIVGGIAVGVNLKMLQGETYYMKASARDLEEGEDLVDDITDDENSKTTTVFDADVGFLLSPVPNVAVGLVARHVTSPKFDFAGDGAGKSSLKLDTQMRFGVAARPIPQVTVAADADLTENGSDILEGYESRQVCLGVEFRPIGFFALRVGAFDNVASSDSDWTYTAGLGFRTPVFAFDIGAAQSSSKTEIESGGGAEEISDRYAIAAVLRFGMTF